MLFCVVTLNSISAAHTPCTVDGLKEIARDACYHFVREISDDPFAVYPNGKNKDREILRKFRELND